MPEHSIIDVVVRTAIIFLYTFIILRLTGRHQLAQLTLFDFLIVIALGSAVGDAMIYAETTVPLVYSMIAIAVVAIIHMFFIKLSEKNLFVHTILYGKPILLVKDGRIDLINLRKEDLTMDDLKSLLREQGIGDIKRVRYAYFEPTGKISVIKKNR